MTTPDIFNDARRFSDLLFPPPNDQVHPLRECGESTFNTEYAESAFPRRWQARKRSRVQPMFSLRPFLLSPLDLVMGNALAQNKSPGEGPPRQSFHHLVPHKRCRR